MGMEIWDSAWERIQCDSGWCAVQRRVLRGAETRRKGEDRSAHCNIFSVSCLLWHRDAREQIERG